MKKHLIAAAVAAAVAVPAMAQVSLSGYVEAGMSSVETGGVSTSKVTNFVGTNTIAMNGSEDLGQGLKAGFTLAQEFLLENGAEVGRKNTSSYAAESGATSWNHAQFEEASLFVSGGFGTIKLGRFNHAVRDNGGNYRFFGDVGRVDSDFRTINKETSNTVQYSSPAFMGTVVHVAYANTGAATPAAAAPETTSYGVFHKSGGLNIGAAQTIENTAATYEAKVTTFGGSYDFGMLKVGFLNGSYRVASSNEKRSVNLVQVAVPAGKGLTVGASYHDYDSSTANTSGKTTTLVAKYDLSKRTSVVGAYANVKNVGTAGFAPASLVGATNNATNSGFGIALTHKF